MKSSKKILILRAGFLQQFICKRAHELGYYVLALDADPLSEGFAYADETGIIRVADIGRCLEYAVKQHPDGVITAANDFGVLSMSKIAQTLGLLGVNWDTACVIKNKASVCQVLYDNNVDDTDCFFNVTELSQLFDIKDKLSYPLMVKPADGSGSRGVSKVSRYEELECACKNALAESEKGSVVIMSFIEGKEYGVESFVDDDIHILCVMQKKMTQLPYFAELGHASESGLPVEIEDRVKECVRKAIKALNINFGCVNMDVIVTDKGSVHIIDIGARMGGNVIGSHIIPLGTGIDYMGNIIKASVGDSVTWKPTLPHRPTVTRLIVLSQGTIASLPDIEQIEKKYEVAIVHHLKVGAEIHEYHANRDGFGYIIAQGNTIDEATKKAENALKDIDRMIHNSQ